MSGYCASGMAYSASRPAIVVTIEMTMARRGRSTKMAESIASASADRRLDRVRPHRCARTHTRQPLDDDLLTAGEAGVHHDAGAGLAARLDAPDHRLAVLDHEHVDALLVGNQGGLRDYDFLFRRPGRHADIDELAIDQRARRIREGCPHQHGVGRAGDRHVDEIDLPLLVLALAVGESQRRLDLSPLSIQAR